MTGQHSKPAWTAPEIVVYGDLAELTQAPPVKLKTPGGIDDFGVPGVQDLSL